MERVLVVGAGLAGSLLAIYLARRGYGVDVFERYNEALTGEEKRPPLNITLCERGLEALARVGLREAVVQLAVSIHGRRVHLLDGPQAYQPYGNRGEAIYSIPRAHLNEVLLQAARREAGIALRFNQKCVGVDLSAGSVRFECVVDGSQTEVHARRIFGADGAHSAVRAQLQKTRHFNYSQQYWAHGGYKSLTIPPHSDGSPALTADALHIWPRGSRMLIGFPNLDGSTTCSLLLPFLGADSFESLSTAEPLTLFFRKAFPDAVDLIPNLEEQFFSLSENSLITVRCAPWSFQDRVLLIGDSAHAVLPSFGQGANAAFEDCATLDECMRTHGSNWTAVFREFERIRKPNMDVMADLCVGHFNELTELVADPAFLKRREIERALNELYPALYNSLYSMVTFGTVAYARALAVEQQQQSLLDRIMDIPDAEQKLATPQVRRILEGVVEERPTFKHDRNRQ